MIGRSRFGRQKLTPRFFRAFPSRLSGENNAPPFDIIICNLQEITATFLSQSNDLFLRDVVFYSSAPPLTIKTLFIISVEATATQAKGNIR